MTTIEMRWHPVPPADVAELRHDDLDARYVRGVVYVHDRHRHREGSAPARNLREATAEAIRLLVTADLQEDARREIEARERDRRRGFSRDRISDRDQVLEIRRRLDDPARVARALGIEKGARRQSGGGLTVLCPWHGERSPSCSVTVAADGTIRARCFSCSATGDVLGLIAAVHHLDARRDFRRVLEVAAAIAGVALPGAA